MKYLIIVLILFSTVTGFSQSIQLVPEKMDTVHVKVSEVTYKGKRAVRVIGNNYNAEELAIIKNIVFNDGTIELDVSGDRLPGTDTSFRGFIGLAFIFQRIFFLLQSKCKANKPSEACICAWKPVS